MELLKMLYGAFGAPFPLFSLFAAFIIGGCLLSGVWWLIGNEYKKSRHEEIAILDVHPMQGQPVIGSSPNIQRTPPIIESPPNAVPANPPQDTSKQPIIKVRNSKNIKIEGNIVAGGNLLDLENSEDVKVIENMVSPNATLEEKIRLFEIWIKQRELKAGDTAETEKWLASAKENMEQRIASLPAEKQQLERARYQQWANSVLMSAANKESTLKWIAETRKSFYERHGLPLP